MKENGEMGNIYSCIQYGKKHFQEFKHNPLFSKAIEELLTSLLFINKIEDSPYSNMYSESYWNLQIQNFIKSFCTIHGICKESPLYLASKAGTIALPKLLKVSNIMKGIRIPFLL
jgi:E3 ubiquitin-protein transferase RMND5